MSESIRVGENQRWHLPYEESSIPGYVKHVYCEGSRGHVLSYGGYSDWMGKIHAVNHCSEPKCIVNYRAEQQLAEIRKTP